MLTLTKGFKKPQNPDTGDVFFPALENDIQQLNDHTHNGTDSQILALASQSIASGAWTSAASKTGMYVQTITVPAAFTYDTCVVNFKLSTGEQIYPSVERASSTTYKVYSPDNTLTFTAYYR